MSKDAVQRIAGIAGLRLLLRGSVRARIITQVHFVRLGEGFIRQINKVFGGPQPLLAGIEHYRE
jgi:hypothetical protein